MISVISTTFRVLPDPDGAVSGVKPTIFAVPSLLETMALSGPPQPDTLLS